MTLPRCLFIAALPFMAAVLMSWLSSDRLTNVIFGLLAWLLFLNVLVAGLAVAGHFLSLAKAPLKTAKIKMGAALLMGVLALPVAILAILGQPLIALGLAALLLVMGLKNLKSSALWALLSEMDAVLITRYSWIAIGAILMVSLAFWRNLQVALV